MADDELILAELLCARLAHDLSGPIGAVANGAELLDEDDLAGDVVGEAVELLSGSAAAAVARLRFLRLALGPAGAQPPPAELRRLAVDYFTQGASSSDAVALDCPAGLEARLGAAPAQLIANLLMLARDCLSRGGTIRVVPPPAGATFALTAEGAQAAPADAVKALTATTAAGLSPRGAQGYFAARVARRAGLAIIVSAAAGRIGVVLEKA
jgi:histidine phosphotransferase ChpT